MRTTVRSGIAVSRCQAPRSAEYGFHCCELSGIRPASPVGVIGMAEAARPPPKKEDKVSPSKSPVVDSAQEGFVITRVFDAPRQLVWKAWTEPEHLMRWWGPKDYTSPVCRIDFRVGGTYLFCMRSPAGKDYWSTGVYREIVPMERFVCTDAFADADGNVVPAASYGMTGEWPDELLVTVTFEDHQGKTRLSLKHVGIPTGEMSELTQTGWNESLDKLAESLIQS